MLEEQITIYHVFYSDITALEMNRVFSEPQEVIGEVILKLRIPGHWLEKHKLYIDENGLLLSAAVPPEFIVGYEIQK